jgi:hypothetical protein
MRRKTIRSMTVAGLATVGLAAGLVTAPSASAEELPSCRIWADGPVLPAGTSIHGSAHRDGCGQRRNITVRIRHDIFLGPDTTVEERTWAGVVNGDFTVTGPCPNGDDGNYFTEILTSAGGKSQSVRRDLHCVR